MNLDKGGLGMKDVKDILILVVGVIVTGAALVYVYKSKLKFSKDSKSSSKDTSAQKRREREETFNSIELKEFLKNELEKRGVNWNFTGNLMSVYHQGKKDFIKEALNILNGSLSLEEKKQKFIELYNNFKGNEKILNFDVNFPKKVNTIPMWIEALKREYGIGDGDPEKVIRKLISKMYEEGIKDVKNSLEVLVKALKNTEDAKKIESVFKDIKRRLGYDDNV